MSGRKRLLRSRRTLAFARLAMTFSIMLKELEPIVDQLSMPRRMLREALAGLSDERLQEKMPGYDWSIRDAMAHLAGNEALMTGVLVDIATGRDESEREFDNEAENAAQVARGKHKTVAELWAELEDTRGKLLEFLNGLTPEQLERRGSHPYQGMMNVREFLVVLYTHEATHVRDMVEWARRLGANIKH